MPIHRTQLVDFFNAGVSAVAGDNAVAQHLTRSPLVGNCYVIAVGKAASAMLHGALCCLPGQVVQALLITKHGHVDAALRGHDTPIEIIESSHPVPGGDSLYAGQRLLAFIAATPADAQLLVLISGGTSSLVDVLPTGMTLDDLQVLNKALLAGGLDIADMNRVRKSVSCIKGGRLARYIGARKVHCLLISDVPGDHIADIGSGLLCAEPATGLANVPEQLAHYVQADAVQMVDSTVWRQIDSHIVASLAHARQAVAEAAQAAGYAVTVDSNFIRGDATTAGCELGALLKQAAPGVYIWGGESTMVLPVNPGRGGRNQHLALAAASVLHGSTGCYLLCAGTDGSDGPTGDAGGIVDGGTLSRGLACGGDWRAALDEADSGRFLQAAGDLLCTGPTGTNVMDLMIGLKLPSVA